MTDLQIDPSRRGREAETGIFVRAKTTEGRWGSFDIAELDAASLHAWLRSRGGDNPWAESVVAILLGHDHTVPPWVATEKEVSASRTP